MPNLTSPQARNLLNLLKEQMPVGACPWDTADPNAAAEFARACDVMDRAITIVLRRPPFDWEARLVYVEPHEEVAAVE